jgi:putative membrane protein insertion efficiency factor
MPSGRHLPVSLPARAAAGLVWVYQRTVSPALTAAFPACGCRFAPTCSHYAREALQTHGFLTGTVLTAVRLAKCGPWHPGGADPVPLARRRPGCARVNPS